MPETDPYTSSPSFFEAKYEREADPWGFASDSYELQRYAAILRALGGRRYRHAYEPGCSIGVLTEKLSERADRVDAFDFSPSASALAKQRCANLPNVHIRCAAMPEPEPVSGYDLLVLSEIGYYFDASTWAGMVSEMVESMKVGGTILLAHWLGHSEDHRLEGDTVHELVLSLPRLRVEHAERTPLFRLERLERV